MTGDAVQAGLNAWIKESERDDLTLNQDVASFLDLWKKKLDNRMHVLIISEILAFISQPRQEPILRELMEHCLYDYCYVQSYIFTNGKKAEEGANEVEKGFYIDNLNPLSDDFVKALKRFMGMNKEQYLAALRRILIQLNKILVFVDWAGQYEKYHNEDLAKGKAIA
jgi:hypothetical protein